ncbi:hypothetical protein MBLNU230_g5704t1 [Neophaeotheca triangularis]
MADQPPKEDAAPAAKPAIPRNNEEHDRFIRETFTNAPPRPSQAELDRQAREKRQRDVEQAQRAAATRFQPSFTRGRANQRARARGNRGNTRGGPSARGTMGGMISSNKSPAPVSDADANGNADAAARDGSAPADQLATPEGDGAEQTTITPSEDNGTMALTEPESTSTRYNQEDFKANLYNTDIDREYERQANMHKISEKQRKKAEKAAEAEREQQQQNPHVYLYSWDAPYDPSRPSKPERYEGSYMEKQHKHLFRERIYGDLTLKEHDELRKLRYIDFVTHPRWGILKDEPWLASPHAPFEEEHDPDWEAKKARSANRNTSLSMGDQASDSDATTPAAATSAATSPAATHEVANYTQHAYASGEDAFAARAAMSQSALGASNQVPFAQPPMGYQGYEDDHEEAFSRRSSGLGHAASDHMTDDDLAKEADSNRFREAAESAIPAITDQKRKAETEEDFSAPAPVKKPKFDARALLAKQGYEQGKGLGKDLSGDAKFINQLVDKTASKAAGRTIGRIHNANQRKEEDFTGPVVRLTNLLAGYLNVEDQQLNHDLFGKITEVLSKSCGRIERVKIRTEAQGGNNEVYLKFVEPVSALSAIQRDGSKQSDLLTEDMLPSDGQTNAEVRVEYFSPEAFEAGDLS